jgi:hypothetical protein
MIHSSTENLPGREVVGFLAVNRLPALENIEDTDLSPLQSSER